MLLQRSLEHDARVQREAEALSSEGHDVTVLELDPSGRPAATFERVAVTVPGRGLPHRARQALAIPGFLAAVRRLRPDAIHAHDIATLPAGVLGARVTGASLVYDSHELATGVAYRRGAVKWLVDRIERLCIGRADAVITVSDSIADRMGRLYALDPPPTVLRNVCALRRPARDGSSGLLRERLGLGTEPLVLHQGAAAPGRGCETLVRGLALVDGAQLVFLGDPEPGFREPLDALASQVGVAERVHFVPSVPLDDLLAHTADADVGVCLFESTSENYRLTLPNKLFEYLAAGVPVLAGATPEAERLVTELGVGWVADPASTREVAAGLSNAIAGRADAALLDRVRAADEEFSWERESRRLVDVYARLSTR